MYLLAMPFGVYAITLSFYKVTSIVSLYTVHWYNYYYISIGVKATSVQASWRRKVWSKNGISIVDIQTKVVELVALTPMRLRGLACLSFLLHQIY